MAVLAGEGVDLASLQPVLDHLETAGASCEIIAPTAGELTTADRGTLEADHGFNTRASVLYDAILVAGGENSVEAVRSKGEFANWPLEAFKHAKPVAAIGSGVRLLEELPLPGIELAPATGGAANDAGVVTIVGGGTDDLQRFCETFVDAITAHRHFDRQLDLVRA